MSGSPYWRGKTVLVTGGTGFIGSFVVEMLVQAGAQVRVCTRDLSHAAKFLGSVRDKIELQEGDLRDAAVAARAVHGQQVVLQLAAAVGGIEYNIRHPGSIFHDNMQLFLQVIEASRKANVEVFLITSSACVYPRHCTIPTPETEGFVGRPEETNEGYGWAKRMEEFLGQAYNREYGMRVAIPRPYNCYGPRDNFDPASSHVIPALIRRIWKDGERPLRVWGSGRQSRSFLYVEDFARGLLEVAEKYPAADPLNIGTDEEMSIADTVEILNQIHEKTNGSRFDVFFDTSKPEGQPRRHCDVRKAVEKIGYKAQVSFKSGLEQTVAWYLSAGMP